MIPSWLAQGNPPCVPGAADSGSASFLEKTIDAVAAFTSLTLLCERHAGRDGLLQRIDPRCKLAAILALIVAVSFLRTPSTVWGVWLAVLILAHLSGIAPPVFLGRVVPFVLLFGAPFSGDLRVSDKPFRFVEQIVFR